MTAADSPQEAPLDTQDSERLLTTTRNLLAELQGLSSRIAAVQEIATAINRSLDLDDMLQVVGRQAKWLLDFDHCSVCLNEPTGERRLVLLFELEKSQEQLSTEADSPIGRALISKQARLMHNAAPPYPSQIIIPLESEGEVLGTLNFAARQLNRYSHDDLRIGYLLALQLAAAIRNASRFAEINKLYAQLEHTYGDLRRSENMRNDLNNMIVHDLRTPLNALLLYIELVEELLRADETKHQVIHLLQRASQAGKRMTGLIQEILNLSKLQDGTLQLNLSNVSLANLIARHETDYLAQAAKNQIALHIDVPTDLPLVAIDEGLIERVIDNLFNNALNFTSAHVGQIKIEGFEQDEKIHICVQDNGLGIPQEAQKTIFDKFSQLRSDSDKPRKQGFGLGLTFCRLAIEAHGGTIWVDSELNKGSQFTFTLPAHQAPEKPVEENGR